MSSIKTTIIQVANLNQRIATIQRTLKKSRILENTWKYLKKLLWLRASVWRGHQKFQKDERLPKKPRKCCYSAFFLREEQTNTIDAVTSEEQETLITFYQNNPALSYHAMECLNTEIEIFGVHWLKNCARSSIKCGFYRRWR